MGIDSAASTRDTCTVGAGRGTGFLRGRRYGKEAPLTKVLATRAEVRMSVENVMLFELVGIM
jgi:hypothetical protein